MADFEVCIIGEGDVTLSGDLILDGETQGDGSHLTSGIPEGGPYNTITINDYSNYETITVTDNTDANFDDNDGNQTSSSVTLEIDGSGTSQTFAAGTVIEVEYEFTVRDSDGNTYRVLAINFRDTSDGLPSYGSIEALAFVDELPPAGEALEIISASEGPPNPGTAVPYEDLACICFMEGTKINTPSGPRNVEDLRSGDPVLGYWGETLTLRQNLTSTFSAEMLEHNPKLRPVCIGKHSLGRNLPTADLYVSRQHRMLVESEIVKRMFDQKHSLVSAIHLTGLPGINLYSINGDVQYHHLIFDQHQIILAEGAPSESLYLGTEAQKNLPADLKQEIDLIFPCLNETQSPAANIPEGRLQKKTNPTARQEF